MKKMPVIYIAGPFRGPNRRAVQKNVLVAEECALRVWENGGAALCPHRNTENFDGLLTDDVWIEGTLELLRRCDAVLVCPGWEQSIGTKGEITEARKLGLPVFFTERTCSPAACEMDDSEEGLWSWIKYR